MLDILMHRIGKMKLKIKLFFVQLDPHICKIDDVHHVPLDTISFFLPVYEFHADVPFSISVGLWLALRIFMWTVIFETFSLFSSMKVAIF